MDCRTIKGQICFLALALIDSVQVINSWPLAARSRYPYQVILGHKCLFFHFYRRKLLSVADLKSTGLSSNKKYYVTQLNIELCNQQLNASILQECSTFQARPLCIRLKKTIFDSQRILVNNGKTKTSYKIATYLIIATI